MKTANFTSLSLNKTGLLTLAVLTFVIAAPSLSAHAQSAPQAAIAADRLDMPTAPSAPHLRLRIAVDQFKFNETRSEIELPRDLREGLQASLVEKLIRSGHFQVMERESTFLNSASQEERIHQEKLNSLDQPGSPKTTQGVTPEQRQKHSSARYIIIPTVTGLQVSSGGKKGFNLGGIRLGGSKQQMTLTLNIRIADSETSQEIDSSTAEGKQEIKSEGLSLNFGKLGYSDEKFKSTPLAKVIDLALADAVAKVSARLDKEPWTALVAAQDRGTGNLILNAGKESGVEVGMEFFVYKSSGDVLDPETGDILTHGDEIKVGRIRIERTEGRVAYARILNGEGFAPKNIVRPAK